MTGPGDGWPETTIPPLFVRQTHVPFIAYRLHIGQWPQGQAISNHFSKFKLCHRSHQRANLPIYLYYHKVGVLTPYIFWRLAFDNMSAEIY